MHTVIVELTEEEYKALACVAASPEEWINNAAHERCRIAMSNIMQAVVQHSLENDIELPKTKLGILEYAQEYNIL